MCMVSSVWIMSCVGGGCCCCCRGRLWQFDFELIPNFTNLDVMGCPGVGIAVFALFGWASWGEVEEGGRGVPFWVRVVFGWVRVCLAFAKFPEQYSMSLFCDGFVLSCFLRLKHRVNKCFAHLLRCRPCVGQTSRNCCGDV